MLDSGSSKRNFTPNPSCEVSFLFTSHQRSEVIFQHDVATNPRIHNQTSGMTMIRKHRTPGLYTSFSSSFPPKKKIKKVVCHNDTSIPFPESPTSKYPLRVCCRWIGQKSHHSFGREKVTSPMNESERSEFFFGDSREGSKNENPHSDWKIWVGECLIE